MQWTDKQVTRLRREEKINLRKEKERNYKIILNILTAESKGITLETVT
jgi:hypothetical protein